MSELHHHDEYDSSTIDDSSDDYTSDSDESSLGEDMEKLSIGLKKLKEHFILQNTRFSEFINRFNQLVNNK